MLFRNFHNLNRLFKDLDSFDDLFFERPNLKGKESVQSGTDEQGEWERKTYVSDTGLFSYSFLTRKSKPIDELSSLKTELDEVVEKQDFERAVELRDKIKNMEKNKEKISTLKKELDESIKNQDFERSIGLRDKINSLK
jgi:protein-arginine kinase activator protein McsA